MRKLILSLAVAGSAGLLLAASIPTAADARGRGVVVGPRGGVAVYRGGGVYRGAGVYRGGYYRGGYYGGPYVRRGWGYGVGAAAVGAAAVGAAAAYGSYPYGYYAPQCGYYPYPPCY